MAIVQRADPTQPARNMRAVTPHASNNLPDGPCRAIFVGGAGNIAVIAADDTDPITLTGVAAGATLPICAKAIRASGTTATGIVALY